MFSERKLMKFFLFFFLFLVSLSASDYLKTLTHVYKQDEFRIYYTLKGNNSLPPKNQLDVNHNGTPDYVENIANQLSEVSKLFIGNFGFIHPLNQPRFKNKANFIDIHLIPLKVNGAARDEIDIKNKSLVIKLSVNLIPTTLTPMHEFFHLIQYGYSMFNNRWSMEGQARWAENAFRKGTGKQKKLPSSIQEMKELTNTIYEASYFWERIAYLSSNTNSTFSYKRQYKNIFTKKYWIQDKTLYGYNIIQNILKNYQIYDKEVEIVYNFPHYKWTEKQQKSFNNNLYIFLSIQKALINLANKNKEISDFIDLINQYKH